MTVPANNGDVRHSAVLILGPTGSGKTPLGEYCEREGLSGRRCVHFDFGLNLRYAAETGVYRDVLTEQDMAVVNRVLDTGMLLEDSQFHIAARILKSFMAKKMSGVDDLVVLNGLPRHTGQATEIDGIINVVMVLYLDCSAEVVRSRIRCNSGGDRLGRNDDKSEDIERKLLIFRERTVPLLDHYGEKGISIFHVHVAEETKPQDIISQIKGDTWF